MLWLFDGLANQRFNMKIFILPMRSIQFGEEITRSEEARIILISWVSIWWPVLALRIRAKGWSKCCLVLGMMARIRKNSWQRWGLIWTRWRILRQMVYLMLLSSLILKPNVWVGDACLVVCWWLARMIMGVCELYGVSTVLEVSLKGLRLGGVAAWSFSINLCNWSCRLISLESILRVRSHDYSLVWFIIVDSRIYALVHVVEEGENCHPILGARWFKDLYFLIESFV